MIYPDLLKPGDKIAIISPATVVKEEYIDGAAEFLRRMGLEPVVMPHAKGPAHGTFAASEADRVADLKAALHDPEVKAILCARGGYGCVHLLRHFTDDEIRDNAKWIIGFSDVSALHALWHRAGVASIHGPMAKHMVEEGDGHHATKSLLRLLMEDHGMDYDLSGSPLNRPGEGRGRLLGGNLAVLDGLASTDCDMLTGDDPDGVILFVEDIAEPIYKVERIMNRLILSGAVGKLKGLIIGQFTEYKPDRNFPNMEEMIHALLLNHHVEGIPVAFCFPVGHVSDNIPLVEGACVELSVTSDGVKLRSTAEPSSDEEKPARGAEITLGEAQRMVDEWIRTVGVRYFSELTNMALLTEETGELARIIARVYGDQVAKDGDLKKGLPEEMADIFWVLTCLANQTGVNLGEAFLKSIEKKTKRDKNRFRK